MGGPEDLAHSALAQRLLQPVTPQLASPSHLLPQAMNDLDRDDHEKGADVGGEEIPQDVERVEMNFHPPKVAQRQRNRFGRSSEQGRYQRPSRRVRDYGGIEQNRDAHPGYSGRDGKRRPLAQNRNQEALKDQITGAHIQENRFATQTTSQPGHPQRAHDANTGNQIAGKGPERLHEGHLAQPAGYDIVQEERDDPQ